MMAYREEELYEGDIIYAGGSVVYTGNILHRGMGYVVESATVSLGQQTVDGYMKRYDKGNALLCSGSNGFSKEDRLKLQKMQVALRLKGACDDNFFVFQALRDMLLCFFPFVAVIFAILSCSCLCIFFENRHYIYLIAAFFSGQAAILAVCVKRYYKLRVPHGYRAPKWLVEELRHCYLPYELEDIEETLQ